jgi:hypothetical protein
MTMAETPNSFSLVCETPPVYAAMPFDSYKGDEQIDNCIDQICDMNINGHRFETPKIGFPHAEIAPDLFNLMPPPPRRLATIFSSAVTTPKKSSPAVYCTPPPIDPPLQQGLNRLPLAPRAMNFANSHHHHSHNSLPQLPASPELECGSNETSTFVSPDLSNFHKSSDRFPLVGSGKAQKRRSLNDLPPPMPMIGSPDAAESARMHRASLKMRKVEPLWPQM